jgi:FAD/FMN-containing dehydrogenase
MITVSNPLIRIPPLFNDLVKVLAGEIDCSHATLQNYSTDGSAYTISPQAVIYPKNTNDIKHTLSFAREYSIPITVRGKGTTRSGGSLGEGVILDMARYFSQIRNINMVENTITVDAGVTVESLLEKIHRWNYDIPFFFGIEKGSTVGGIVATKSTSGGSFHHGTVREWIEGLTVVVDNGEEHTIADGITPSGRLLGIYQSLFPFLIKEAPILRASKPKSNDDGTGYNVWQTSIGPRQLIDQLVGSEGTLGIITSITFRITPYKPHSITSCIPVLKKELLPTYIEIAKHHKSEHIFLCDEAFMQLGERYASLSAPLFHNTPYVLLVTHTGSDKEKVHHAARALRSSFKEHESIIQTIDVRESLEHLTDPSFLFSLFSSYTNHTHIPLSAADGLIVTLQQIPLLLAELEDYLNSLGRLYTITGNIGSGHISVITLFDPHSKNYINETIAYSKKIFSLLKKYNGGMSAVHGEGIARTPFLSAIYNDATLSLFKTIKTIWDPLSVLNPGKKQDISLSYLEQHLRQNP